jgi:hypothetical protein
LKSRTTGSASCLRENNLELNRKKNLKVNQIKVGFFSRQNYLDKTTFSGTLYYMRAALKARESANS